VKLTQNPPDAINYPSPEESSLNSSHAWRTYSLSAFLQVSWNSRKHVSCHVQKSFHEAHPATGKRTATQENAPPVHPARLTDALRRMLSSYFRALV
jgi:hypothetical protein